MEHKRARHAILAFTLVSGLLTQVGFAQQAGTTQTAKPANETATPPVTTQGGSTTEATDPSKKVVIKVGAVEIMQSEIDFLISNLAPQQQQTLAASGRRVLGDEFVRVLLLAQKAETDHLDANQEIRDQLELQRNQTLAKAEVDKMSSELKVAPEEIGQYYNTHLAEYETAEVRDFVVRIKPEGAKEGTPGLPVAEAKTKAEAIRQALLAGADAKTVAKDSAVPNVVMVDDQPRSVKRGQLLPILDKAAFELKEGQVSEIYQAPQAMVFIQVVGRHTPEQKEVATEIESRVRTAKLETAIGDLRNGTKVWMDDDYFKSQTATATPSTTVPTVAPQKPKP